MMPATLEELQALFSNSALMVKVQSALTLEAQALLDLPDTGPTADQIAWAVDVLRNPSGETAMVLRYVVAANAESTAAQIEGASEQLVKNNVAAVVPKLVAAKAGV
jgi:hypothetical protein